MTAFANLSEYINRMTGGNSGSPQNLQKYMNGRIAGVAAPAVVSGRPASLWTYDSTRGGAGTTPTTVEAPDRSFNGGMLQANASGGRELWLTWAGAAGNVAGRVLLYDRLLHIGGLDATNTGAQTVGGTLTRNTSGVGNQIWVVVYTQVGATGTTITASYTNQSGTAGRTTTARTFGGTSFREQTRAMPLPLQAGDTGVQSVESVTVLGTTGAAGNFGVVVAKPLLSIPLLAVGQGGDTGALSKARGPILIDTDACIAMWFFPNATTAPELWIDLSFCER